MASSLKQELKLWEATFRSEHGRDPTKSDIKLQPDIAAKYKQYNRSKLQSSSGASRSASLSIAASTSVSASASTSAARARPPSNPFQTPTKPKPSRSVSKPADPSTSSDALPALPSPSKRSSAGKSTASAPQYVLANSPSKLRALAALHSTSGSPNRPAGANWLNATTTGGTHSTTMIPSPRKAKNPFASPRKEGAVDLFGEFEKQERERMREKKRQAKKEGKLGKGATGKGLGWGHASASLDTAGSSSGKAFSRASSIASSVNGMDLDEVDEFFGGSSQASSARPTVTQSQSQATIPDDDPDEDEVLGPSPVKPSISGPFFGLPNSTLPAKKPFKSLLADSPLDSPQPFASSSSSAAAAQPRPGPKPKLFETSLRASTTASPAPSAAPPPAPSSAALLRGLKRPSSAAAPQKIGSTDPGALLDDADDDFYADALAMAEGVGEGGVAKKGKGRAPVKRKKVVSAAKGAGKGKGKAKASEECMDLDDADEASRGDAMVARSRPGELVLDVERGEERGGGRERLVIHEKGWELRQRRVRRGGAKDGEGEGDEGGTGMGMHDGEEGFGEDDEQFDDITLLDRPRPGDLLSRSQPRPRSRSASPSEKDPTSRRLALASTLPASLASMLSLRSSPQKSTTSARDLQVAKLLGEPTTRRKHRGGLLELEDEEGEEEDEAEEGGVDDDWDEEVDGWKETGGAMDGYYSGDGEGW
ncbi:hypothetical protein JCM21900_001929 [Sporobolomyces salmonicolor]